MLKFIIICWSMLLLRLIYHRKLRWLLLFQGVRSLGLVIQLPVLLEMSPTYPKILKKTKKCSYYTLQITHYIISSCAKSSHHTLCNIFYYNGDVSSVPQKKTLGCITYKVYPSPSSDKFTTYPKYLLHKICENVESLAKSDELSKSNFLKGIQEVK